mmetsp:Transcript_7680/g.20345  ORF Transcript_7680/g.20345 Transcript_7680/m.20345 type:complete len:227 (+) Transcript_7680:198-878(+)
MRNAEWSTWWSTRRVKLRRSRGPRRVTSSRKRWPARCRRSSFTSSTPRAAPKTHSRFLPICCTPAPSCTRRVCPWCSRSTSRTYTRPHSRARGWLIISSSTPRLQQATKLLAAAHLRLLLRDRSRSLLTNFTAILLRSRSALLQAREFPTCSQPSTQRTKNTTNITSQSSINVALDATRSAPPSKASSCATLMRIDRRSATNLLRALPSLGRENRCCIQIPPKRHL